MLVITLVLSCTSSTSFLRALDRARGASRSRRSHASTSSTFSRSAATSLRWASTYCRSDLLRALTLVDARDFLADRLDDRVALGERRRILASISSVSCASSPARASNAAIRFSENASCERRCSSALDGRLQPLELILGGVELGGDVALAALDAAPAPAAARP